MTRAAVKGRLPFSEHRLTFASLLAGLWGGRTWSPGHLQRELPSALRQIIGRDRKSESVFCTSCPRRGISNSKAFQSHPGSKRECTGWDL